MQSSTSIVFMFGAHLIKRSTVSFKKSTLTLFLFSKHLNIKMMTVLKLKLKR